MQGMSSEEELTRKKLEQDVESTLPKDEEQVMSPKYPGSFPLSEADREEGGQEAISPEEIPKALAAPKESSTVALLPKILRTTRLYFSSGNFFFSYDYDLSRCVGEQKSNSSLPLFKQYDPLVRLL